MLGTPFINLCPPSLNGEAVGTLRRLLYDTHHLSQNSRAGADDGNVSLDIFRHRSGVDIDMNNGRPWAKLLEIIGYTVIKTGTDGKNYIGIVHRGIGLVGSMHTEHAHK